jgi:hypothetical protein
MSLCCAESSASSGIVSFVVCFWNSAILRSIVVSCLSLHFLNDKWCIFSHTYFLFAYLLWRNVCSIFLPILIKFFGFFLLNFKWFGYFGHKYFICYVFCKYFLPGWFVIVLTLTFTKKFLILITSNLFFKFMQHNFYYHIKTSPPNSDLPWCLYHILLCNFYSFVIYI